MGEAIVAAVLAKSLAVPRDICVSDISDTRREYLQKQYGVVVTANNREAMADRDVLVLAVKPQNLADVLSDLKGSIRPVQLVLSIVAGVKIETIVDGLGHKSVVRCMPNTPAQIGFGMSAWTATPRVTETQKEQSKAILGAMGKEIYFEDEECIDIATAVSGSGPAYCFLFAEALVDAAVSIGLSVEEACEMVSQTMLGSVHLMQQSGKPPAELRRNVTSPGGTTESALKVFEEGGFRRLIENAVKAAYRRARELGD